MAMLQVASLFMSMVDAPVPVIEFRFNESGQDREIVDSIGRLVFILVSPVMVPSPLTV